MKLSHLAIGEFLPLIKAVVVDLEIQIADSPNIDQYNPFIVSARELEKALPSHELEAIMNEWLQGTGFSFKYKLFDKSESSLSWKSLLKILNAKLLEYCNSCPLIVLKLESKTGRIIREVMGDKLVADFGLDGQKFKIILFLTRQKELISREEIKVAVGSSSADAIRQDVGSVNSSVERDLQLPPSYRLIEDLPRKGCRINPIYNLVVV